jgi:hypothetical protein
MINKGKFYTCIDKASTILYYSSINLIVYYIILRRIIADGRACKRRG